jgi:hypothetical protein
MNRPTLCVETRGICNWRERLAKPDSQWRRGFSAFETAVSWERAACDPAGLPEPIVELFRGCSFGEAKLLLAIAEHKVPLVGGLADSQCDVWALLNTGSGGLSLSVEAKAKEPFGEGNESLERWLVAGGSERSRRNREDRWKHISAHLPSAGQGAYSPVPYQLLHRCAAAVIEAYRFGLSNAAFVVQAFNSPAESFAAFSQFCQAVNLRADRGQMHVTSVGEICLGIGWVDCPFATDADVAAVA